MQKQPINQNLKMKKYLLILFVMLGCFSGIKAQDPGDDTRAEKIQALKIAFITQKLQLTSAMKQKNSGLFITNMIMKFMALPKGGNVIDMEEKLLNIRKKYQPHLKK